jgi:gamma-glutamyl phosphate reductase
MNLEWLVEQCRIAARNLAAAGDYSAAAALDALADQLEADSARIQEEHWRAAGWTPPAAPEPEVGAQ